MASIAGMRAVRARPRTATQFDPFMVVLIVVLNIFGLVTIWSASGAEGGIIGQEVSRQAFYFVAGMIAMFTLASINYKYLKSFAAIAYVGSVGLLFTVLAIGETISGSTRWFFLGPISFQPSELAKIATIIALAAFISERRHEMDRLSNFLISIGIVALPMGLVFMQPDLGTTGVFAAIWLGMIVMSSTRLLYLVGLALLAIPGVAFAWLRLLHDYQKDRLMVSFDPDRDYLGQGYNIIQARITIGSAGWFGHGLHGGSQAEFNLLKVSETDFIFAHAMSMFGFVGGIALFLAFMLLFWRMLRAVTIAHDTFGQQLAIGITSMFFFQTFVNIGMNLGIMPVTGIPLPFISLGGTALFFVLVSFGIIQSIIINHRKLGFQSL
ncbi:MAG: rod shape-determining protein RodA [Thermomicrobiales bacterium]|nr:rod shape-determining protein RodA [Thermomicrobiales bacterium]